MTTINGYEVFKRIRFLATKRGISIRQVALKAGFRSPNTIYRYNQGVNPRKPSLNAIAEVLNTTTDYLSGKTDNWEKKSRSKEDADLDRMLDDTRSFDGKPMTKHDREVIRDYLEWRFHNKK